MNSDANTMSFTIGFTAGGAVTLALRAAGTTACSLFALIMVVVFLGVVVAMKNSERVKMAVGRLNVFWELWARRADGVPPSPFPSSPPL